jgi:4-hydroxy-3-polyprenylbenzoate decarboxylase
MPVLGNLFGTQQRVARAMGVQDVRELRQWRCAGRSEGTASPAQPARGVRHGQPAQATVEHGAQKRVFATCQEQVWEGADVDLARLPIQHCWPGDVAPLVTWGLVITRGPHKRRQNLGIYRQQVLSRNQLIMRWLPHRGGALDFRDHALANKGQPFPVAVALGADPATMLGAVTPVPDSLSEYQFAGLLRGGRTELADALGNAAASASRAEIVLEGHIYSPMPRTRQWL